MLRAQTTILPLLAPMLGTQLLAAQANGGLIKRTPETVQQTRQSERRVTLDVQITDAAGKPIKGLQQQDVTVLDSGQPQALTSFREINSASGQPPAEVILLLDTMNATFQDVTIERQGIDTFLRQNGGHLALPVSVVFLTASGVKLHNPSMDGNAIANDLRAIPTPQNSIAFMRPEQAQDRAQTAFHSLQLLTTYEASRPGRKLMIWVGPGWPLLSRTTVDLSRQDHARYFSSIVDMTTGLRRAHVTLYSVAPLNLAEVGGQDSFLYEAYLKGVEKPEQADSTNLALQVLALHSGGLALSKSGDLATQIARCIDDGKDYYELTFDTVEAREKEYHALQVKVDRPGAKVRTDASYYAGVAEDTPTVRAAEVAATKPAATAPRSDALRADARLVVVDVSVLDQKGLPVQDLKASDFHLNEDRAPQTIVSFEPHTAAETSTGVSNAEANPSAAASNSDTVVASNALPQGTAWNIVLIDLFNTGTEDRSLLQEQVERFLKQLPERQPLALVTMSDHIKIETTFQEGAVAAYQYLHKHGLGPIDASTPANIVQREDLQMPMDAATIQNKANVDVDRQANRAQTTLDCFSALAQWLMPYPGKKIVYWLTGGFPLQGQPFGVDAYSIHNLGVAADTKGSHPLPMQQKTDKELESARVAIYPVDARGVAATDVDGITTADSVYGGNVALVAGKDNSLAAARRQEMLEIAKATGGQAQFSNNIAGALHADFAQANAFYTLAYTPPDKEWKGAYHHIQIAVDKPETHLVYRTGYYARSAVTTITTPEEFKDALRLDSPEGAAVQFTAKVTNAGDQATVEYNVEPKTVEFAPDTAGQFPIELEFAIVEFNAKGKALDKSLIRLSGKMTPEQRAHVSAKSLSAKQTIGLKKGATTLVLGVRDQASGRFGKVQVALPSR